MGNNLKTYISLFSSAGVGCFGFKQAGFECVATNELIERRLEIQKFNKKCKYESGYICGDITRSEIQNLIYKEIDLWKKKEHIDSIDVVIATPPCQGMSVANHKKHSNEIVRNSLVMESIKIIKKIRPKFFVFENVPAFMKTLCTDIDGHDKPISEAIKSNLGDAYTYYHRVINFKNYGSCSSRFRTLVIGVNKELEDYVSPFELFPSYQEEKTLRETIGGLKSLKLMGEIDPNDIYHSFRTYAPQMREWIKDLKEGECAFDNKDNEKKPHQIIDGKLIINKRKNADKYTRQFWDKVGPCVHTRNDQLASQNTIHPSDDRVFSIRELMLMMTVPSQFRWSSFSVDELNRLSESEKAKYLKKEEIKIRQSLGEAVPTIIFKQIAENIIQFGLFDFRMEQKVTKDVYFESNEELLYFLDTNPRNLSPYSLTKIAELNNTNRTSNAAYYTNKSLITKMLLHLNVVGKDELNVLEPSVGVGNILFQFIKKYEDLKLNIDVCDVDSFSLQILKLFLKKFGFSNRIQINFINDDFLTYDFSKKYDVVIGNPPFDKLTQSNKKLRVYKLAAINKQTNNIASFFLDKIIQMSEIICLVFPKFLLNTPEFAISRNYLSKLNFDTIIDFGENGFKGVLIETIAIIINTCKKPSMTRVCSFDSKYNVEVEQSYIMNSTFPYWIIYRNEKFDLISSKMTFGVFSVFRDRQITNRMLAKKGSIWVVKSRNILDDGTVIHIDKYDSYIDDALAKKTCVYKYLRSDNAYLSPNMTFHPRVVKKPKDVLVNGSVAILIPKQGISITKEQLMYFSTDEYRYFYNIARNKQTRSLNIDACSVYFYGLIKGS